jgi:hypothetical protein
MSIENFEGNNGWLTKFSKRHGISFQTICGESAAVDMVPAQDWIDNISPGLIEGYDWKKQKS